MPFKLFVLCGSGRTAVVQIGDGEGDDDGAAICGPGTLMRSDVLACIAHLRAFAIMLAGDHRRADDLVCDTIEQTFTEVNRLPTGVDLKVQMFAVLHGLHYGALRSSTEGSRATAGVAVEQGRGS